MTLAHLSGGGWQWFENKLFDVSVLDFFGAYAINVMDEFRSENSVRYTLSVYPTIFKNDCMVAVAGYQVKIMQDYDSCVTNIFYDTKNLMLVFDI